MNYEVIPNVTEWISLQINTYTNDLIFIYSYLKSLVATA